MSDLLITVLSVFAAAGLSFLASLYLWRKQKKSQAAAVLREKLEEIKHLATWVFFNFRTLPPVEDVGQILTHLGHIKDVIAEVSTHLERLIALLDLYDVGLSPSVSSQYQDYIVTLYSKCSEYANNIGTMAQLLVDGNDISTFKIRVADGTLHDIDVFQGQNRQKCWSMLSAEIKKNVQSSLQ